MLTHNTRGAKGSGVSLTARRTIADDLVSNISTLRQSNDEFVLTQQQHEKRLAALESIITKLNSGDVQVVVADTKYEERIQRAEVLIVDMKTELDRIAHLIEEDTLFAPVPVEEGYSDFQHEPAEHAENQSAKEDSNLDSIACASTGASDSLELGTASVVPTTELPVVVEEVLVEHGAPADLVGSYTIEEDEDETTDEQRERELDQAMAESVSAVAARLDSLHVKQPGELKKKVSAIEASFRQRQLERRKQKMLSLSCVRHYREAVITQTH